MSSVISGNTSGSIASIGLNIPATIASWSLVNKTGGSITASVVIIPEDASPVYVWSGSIAANATQDSDKPINLPTMWRVLIVVSGSTDYFFSLT